MPASLESQLAWGFCFPPIRVKTSCVGTLLLHSNREAQEATDLCRPWRAVVQMQSNLFLPTSKEVRGKLPFSLTHKSEKKDAENWLDFLVAII
jgi:hypothetical protein